jgi:predicted dehydrogenase
MTSLAIVGAGVMGANHARVARALAGLNVTHIVDPDEEKASALAAHIGADVLASIDDLPTHVDAAVVATPSNTHEDVGSGLLDRGLHVLVEKPFAVDPAAAERLRDRSRQTGRVCLPGHVERFNPAVLELPRLVTVPLHIDIRRLGPRATRINDGVIMDLMIHDIDLVRFIAGSDVVEAHCIARCIDGTVETMAFASLRLASGATATLAASQVGQSKVRQIEITQPDNVLFVDLLRQDVSVTRVQSNEFLSAQGARYRQDGYVEIPYLQHHGEPLLLQLEHFVQCIDGRTEPTVTADDGVAAVSVATEMAAEAKRW